MVFSQTRWCVFRIDSRLAIADSRACSCIRSVSRSPQIWTRAHVAPVPIPLRHLSLPNCYHGTRRIPTHVSQVVWSESVHGGARYARFFCIQQYVQVVLFPLVLLSFTDSAYCYSARVRTVSVCLCARSRAFNAALFTAQPWEHPAPRGTPQSQQGNGVCIYPERYVSFRSDWAY